MNERELTRRLSTTVVEALKAQGHILVVKGGAQALGRELEELMTPTLAKVALRLSRGVVMGEVTSTFGDDAVDEAVEELVVRLTRALMESDHVEDVFAEDNVIRRDVFRTLRDGLLRPGDTEGAEPEEATVKVRLDTLGYVAATVAKLADPEALREALEQAGALVEAELVSFSSETREATYSMTDAGPDGRLALEESVDDELTAMVEDGLVDLPTLSRKVDVGRDVDPAEQKAAKARVEAIASNTIHRAGAATWEFEGRRTIKITFTPLSEQDAREVDQPVALFARGVAGLFAAPVVAAEPAAPSPAPSAPVANSRASLRSDAPVANSRASLRSDAPVANSRASLRSDAPVTTSRTSRSSDAQVAEPRSEKPSSRRVEAKVEEPAPSEKPRSSRKVPANAPASGRAPAEKPAAKKAAATKTTAAKKKAAPAKAAAKPAKKAAATKAKKVARKKG